MAEILVVEDEEMISQLVQDFLSAAGYEVTVCFDGDTAWQLVQRQKFHLIILDIMLPKLSGLEVLQKIRGISEVPIIMLTALDDEQTQLISFNQRIDDYVTKPFSPSILVKRVENTLRKHVEPEITEKKIGELVVDYDSCELKYAGKSIELTKKEFEIFSCLAKRSNYTVTREQIINSAWGYEDAVDTRILDNHIRNLRKKIPQVNIQTIKGIGYKLEVNK